MLTRRLRLSASFLLCCCLAILPRAILAGAWQGEASSYFVHFSIPRDLPNVPEAIAQDQAGLIWIGTQDGLVRWDGYRARIFRHDPQQKNSLPANFVTGLHVDRQNRLLVLTAAGVVARYEPETESFKAILPAVSVGGYAKFTDDGNGGLWLGNSDGLFFLAEGADHWRAESVLENTKIGAMLMARDGTLWVGTTRGLLRRNRNMSDFLPFFAQEVAGSSITALFESDDGRIWFGTRYGKVGNVAPDDHVALIAEPPDGNAVRDFAALDRERLCYGRDNGGLNCLSTQDGSIYRREFFDPMRPSGLADSGITTLFVDRSGGLWIGHYHGLDYVAPDNGTFTSLLPSFRDPAALAGDTIISITEAGKDRFWLGEQASIGELFDLKQGRVAMLNKNAKLAGFLPSGSYALQVLPTGPDSDWIATNRGLFERHGTSFRRFEALEDTAIRQILPDGDILWIATEIDGIAKLNRRNGQLSIFRRKPEDPTSISENSVVRLLLDPDHGLWVATDHGLNLFDPVSEKFRRFFHDDADQASLPSDLVTSLMLDRQKRLWVGSFGGGMALLDSLTPEGARFHRIGIAEGLRNDNVDLLLPDNFGRIWASTDDGIAMIDPASFAVRSFGPADGLRFTGYFLNSGARAEDGRLLFGGIGGVTIVHPDRVGEWDYRPPVVVTALSLNGKPVAVRDTIILQPDDRNLQIEFSALDYTAPLQNRYGYRLEGFDADWINADANHRLAAYSSLPPGQFKLLIRGSNRNGLWTDPPTVLTVQVLPHWFQTLWFRVLALLLGILAVAALVQTRTAYLLARQRDLEARVAERTSELNQAREELERLASEDSLTRVANRRRFDEVLSAIAPSDAAPARPVTLMMIDVDDFKAYNDRYGHPAGDAVLRQVAAICKAQLRRANDLIARFGGEEFALILPDLPAEQALVLAQSIVRAVSDAAIPHGSARAADHVTISIGVATSLEDIVISGPQLLAAADRALYEAKRTGRNRAVRGEISGEEA